MDLIACQDSPCTTVALFIANGDITSTSVSYGAFFYDTIDWTAFDPAQWHMETVTPGTGTPEPAGLGFVAGLLGVVVSAGRSRFRRARSI
jgi:hypothetical protein